MAQSTQNTGGFIPSVQQSSLEVSRLLLSQVSLDTNDKKLKISGLFDQWVPGAYKVGDIRNVGDQTWECYQECDNSEHPDVKPGNPAWFTFWKPLHGQSPETARPFVPVQGSHDIYKAGEYMVWTDGKIYECIQNTNFSPIDYPQAWKVYE